MRNLKLKQVLPVDTETETLQKSSMADNGLRLASESGVADAHSSIALHSVKETPGLHVMGDLYGVHCEDCFLLDSDLLRAHCLKLVEEAGLSSVGDFFHQFDGAGGVTGMVVLAESHMSIHTWPEYGYAAVDIFTCGTSVEPEKAAEALIEKLGAKNHSLMEIQRGLLVTV